MLTVISNDPSWAHMLSGNKPGRETYFRWYLS
jgi:hypothetical protein